MLGPTTLRIYLAKIQGKFKQGTPRLNQYIGGPETLLLWLEEQLGIVPDTISLAERTVRYAQALKTVNHACLQNALTNELWSTTSALLRRREELLLAGWDPENHDVSIPLAEALALAESEVSPLATNADRVAHVIKQLKSGATLPEHTCQLPESIELWPPLWQTVLNQLNTVDCSPTVPQANTDRTLHSVQANLLQLESDQESSKQEWDESIHWLQARSEAAAIDFISTLLLNSRDELTETVIYCESPILAAGLDARLATLGLPTTGAGMTQTADPIRQILPLALAITRTPVDPQPLLEFLTLPVCPIPAQAARRLAQALTDMPGIDNQSWHAAMQEIEQAPNHEHLCKRIETWIYENKVSNTDELPTSVIATVCRNVSQWAMSRSLMMTDKSKDRFVANSLRSLASRASVAADLVELLGTTIEQPQLERLLQDILGQGAYFTSYPAMANGPTIVNSLADIQSSFQRLIWLGVGTQDSPKSKWSSHHRSLLGEIGIHCDDGSNRLFSQRNAEAAGFSRISDTMLLLGLPQDEELRHHPICQSMRGYIHQHIDKDWEPDSMEGIISSCQEHAISPFKLSIKRQNVVHGQPTRPSWDLPSDLIHKRDRSSATELETKVGCPLKWVLNYSAKVRGSDISNLPEGVRLYGNLMHSVLENVFNSPAGRSVNSTEQAIALVEQEFDNRLPLEAANLALPENYGQANDLKAQLTHATRVLFEIILEGGYEIVGLEVDIDAQVSDTPLGGSIDCLLKQEKGRRAIIDFKFGSGAKYQSFIEDGRAVQLATYASSQTPAGTAYPCVAYLILSTGQLITPSGDPIQAAQPSQIAAGPGIEQVWEEFVQAIQKAEDWFSGNIPVTALPIIDVEDWPRGTELVLDPGLKEDAFHGVCKYCDYSHFCGLTKYG